MDKFYPFVNVRDNDLTGLSSNPVVELYEPKKSIELDYMNNIIT